jgi:hypothetical protein
VRLLFSLLVATHTLCGQVAPLDFLNSAHEDPEVRSLDQRIDFLKAMPFRLAPVQRLEFRMRNNQLDPDRQDYALRITPTNPWEARNSNRYFEEYERGLRLERELALKRALRSRYDLWAETAYQNDRVALYEAEVALAEKLVLLQSARQTSSDFDMDDLLEARLDVIDLQLELDELQLDLGQRLAEVAAVFPLASGKKIDWSLAEMVAPSSLGGRIDSLHTQATIGGEVAYRESRVRLAAREAAVQKSNMNLGFLQAQYEPYRTEQGREPWSLSLGFVIPVFNPNKGDVAERRLDEMEAQFELDETAAIKSRQRTKQAELLRGLIDQYASLERRKAELEQADLRKALYSGSETNPVLPVRYEQSLLRLSAMKLRLNRQILLAYIAYLDEAEVLQHPDGNRLRR